MPIQPCELHELTACAICNGTERRFQDSLRDPVIDRGLSDHGGPSGPTIAAHYNGHCAACGRSFDAGDSIQHSRDADGWVAECCR